MNVPFEYIKIDLRDFNSIKDLRRSLKAIGVSDEVAKSIFHIKDDKKMQIIFVDKIYFEVFAYYDKNAEIHLCGSMLKHMENENWLKFVPKGEKKVFAELVTSNRSENINMSVDLILDKISLSGINSLTKMEKDFLENIK